MIVYRQYIFLILQFLCSKISGTKYCETDTHNTLYYSKSVNIKWNSYKGLLKDILDIISQLKQENDEQFDINTISIDQKKSTREDWNH